MGFLNKLKEAFGFSADSQEYLNGFAKTNAALGKKLRYITEEGKVDGNAFMEELMITLIESDMGFHTAEKVCERFEKKAKRKKMNTEEVLDLLTEALAEIYNEAPDPEIVISEKGPTIILMVGVNGSGKTTTTAKLAWRCQQEGKRVALAAADTFRAGAIEQLAEWGERLGVPVIKGKPEEDPSSVLVEACRFAWNNSIDVLLCDTAGRLQNKKNLMAELSKMNRVCAKEIPGAPHNTWLVLDANTGQNGLSQAQLFKESTDLNGIILTKMDGTAKGGIVVAIKDQLGLPVRYLGFGEKKEDLKDFDLNLYLYSIIEGLGDDR